MAGNKPISGFPVAVTTVGASFAAVQGGNNVQVPASLFSGTVSTISVVSANGFSATVANPTTTPALTLKTTIAGLLKGDGTQLLLATNADLPSMTSTVGGAVPTPPNNTTTFLRGDGTFATPAGAGTVTHTGTLTASALMLGNGSADVTALGSLGTTTTLLHGNAAGNPSFGAVSLTADITGTLAETHGGTNQATYTTGDILYASGSNTLAKLGIGSAGNYLTISGGVPAWGSSSANGMTLVATLATTSGSTLNAGALTLTSYNILYIEFESVTSTAITQTVTMNISNDGGSTFDTATNVCNVTTSASVSSGSSQFFLSAPGITAVKQTSSIAGIGATGFAVKTGAINYIRFVCSGTFATGAIKIWGMK